MSKMERLTKALHGQFAAALVALLVGVAVSAVVLVLAGFNPLEAFGAMLHSTLSRPKYTTNVILKAAPILLTGVSVAFAYQTGLFNIGAEGQYIMGTICASVVGYLVNLPMILQVPLVLLSGIAGGALLGGFVGRLKGRFGIHEVISSIMCNWIAFYLCNFVVSTEMFHRPNSSSAFPVNPSSYTMILGSWKKTAAGKEFLMSNPWLRDIVLKTHLNYGFLIAVLVAILIAFVLKRTKLGYELRAVGHNRDASRFSGIPVERNIVLSMLISGAICGLSGALTITGISPHSITELAAMEGYGFNGMSVAFIAGCSPLGCIPASLLFSGLLYGGISVQQAIGAPSEIISIMIGTIVFFTALPGIAPAITKRLEAWQSKRKSRGTDASDTAKEEA